MNNVNGSCACCEEPTAYTGKIPILCKSCRGLRQQISDGSVSLLGNSNLNTRLFLPDSELVPRGITEAELREGRQ